MELIMEKSGDAFVFMYVPTFVNARNACIIRQALSSKAFRLEAFANEMVLFVADEDIHIRGERNSLFAFMRMVRSSEVRFGNLLYSISGKEGFAVRTVREERLPEKNRRQMLRKMSLSH